MTIWEMVEPEFSRSENWGDHTKISGFLLVALLIIRRETGWPIIIHNAYESDGHKKTGDHPNGEGADWHFKTDTPFKEQVIKVLSILENYQIADRVGLGIYPFWNSKGFHLGIRGHEARWSFNKDGVMVPFNDGII